MNTVSTEHHNKPSGFNSSSIYGWIVGIMIVLGLIKYMLEKNGIYMEDVLAGTLGVLYVIWQVIKWPLLIAGGLLIIWRLVKFIKAAWED